MGIKRFYGYCKKQVPNAFRNVQIIDEIENYTSGRGKAPVIVINLSTMIYYFRVQMNMFIFEHRMSLIEDFVSEFFESLKKAGAELIFIFKRPKFDEEDFLTEKLDNCRKNQEILSLVDKIGDAQKLRYKLRDNSSCHKFNMHLMQILVQASTKFGKLHYTNSYDYLPCIEQFKFLEQVNADYIIGLDTYFFLGPGYWKIWSDDTLHFNDKSVVEIDKNAIMKHLHLKPIHLPLYAVLLGDLKSTPEIKHKVEVHFGMVTKFVNAARFVNQFKFPLTDDSYVEISNQIFGKRRQPETFVDDMKSSLDLFVAKKRNYKVDDDIITTVRDDFTSYALQILTNDNPIFISPNFLDASLYEKYVDLVLPWIQKTAGILLKNSEDKDPRYVIFLKSADEQFQKEPLEIIYPDFEVPPIKEVVAGHLATYEKMKMLFHVTDVKISKIELPTIGQEYIVDSILLLYLVKHKMISVIEARCLFRTIIDVRHDKKSIIKGITPPKKFNKRALTCSFLYMKLFIELHSCLNALGMKNYCPKFAFDGVYFHKVYALNVLGEDEDEDVAQVENKADQNNNKGVGEKKIGGETKQEDKVPEKEDYNQTEIIDLFADMIIS